MYIRVYREHNIYTFGHLTFMDNVYQGGVWACMGVHERARPCTPTRPLHADFPLPPWKDGGGSGCGLGQKSINWWPQA